ncbi:hypothetical protein J2Z49_002944 [Desulfofundulus luciae]|uniref:ParB/Sulfiredoxin domain-containing protein n=1 Tax=Desulfofundulus luciae TaxID=74702 RepID=A0ABU0B7B9_9FIRM|nr:hypothetical protein [Desulfofundulus luciae]MDQ0287811.1 hypothetical protein [Desulfofundulus luciae]
MEIKLIPLTSLLVNTENPRYEMVSNQQEAIQLMIEEQKDKLVKLAEDILANGLNPSDLIMVTPYEKNESQFVVLEGNRRIVALKLLNNPNLILEKHKSLYRKFKQLNESFEKNPIVEIPCIIFSDEKESYKWIRLKHTGENDGIGTVSWDAQQKARFEERMEGKAKYSLQVIEFLKNQDNIEEEFKKQLKEVPLSSLQRLLSDPDVRGMIGIEIENGKVVSRLEPDEVIKPLKRIVNDLLRDDFTVKQIYYKDDRLNYIESFTKNDIPDKTKTLDQKWELMSALTLERNKKERGPTRQRNKPLSTKRKTLIPKSCIIPINNPRINKIYRELKDLDLDNFCNAGAVLFRVFIELSIDAFIEKYKLPKMDKDTKLHIKVQAVADYLEANGYLDKHQSKGIKTSVSDPNNIMSINTFHSYIHNKNFNPIASDLKLVWDNIEPFIITLWNQI